MMPVGQRAAESAEGDHVRVTGSRPQYERVPAPDGEPDRLASWQVVQPRLAQRQVSAFPGDCVPSQECRNSFGELREPLCPLARAWPLLSYVRPLAGCVTSADAQ
jgi:hypothetical protein